MQKNRIKHWICQIGYCLFVISFGISSVLLIMHLVWWCGFWILTLIIHIKYGMGK